MCGGTGVGIGVGAGVGVGVGLGKGVGIGIGVGIGVGLGKGVGIGGGISASVGAGVGDRSLLGPDMNGELALTEMAPMATKTASVCTDFVFIFVLRLCFYSCYTGAKLHDAHTLRHGVYT